MSLTQFPCQYCGRTQSVPSTRNGQSILCRNCGGDNLVPGVPPPPSAAPEPVHRGPPIHQADAEHSTCPYCGEVIKAAAIKCRHCGERLESGRQPQAGQVFGGPVGGGPPRMRDPADRFHAPGQLGGPGRGPMGGFHPDLQSAANTSIVLAILGLVFCWGLPAPFALIKANEAKSLAQRYQVPVPSQASIAAVLAWIAIVMWGGIIVLFGLGMAAAMFA